MADEWCGFCDGEDWTRPQATLRQALTMGHYACVAATRTYQLRGGCFRRWLQSLPDADFARHVAGLARAGMGSWNRPAVWTILRRRGWMELLAPIAHRLSATTKEYLFQAVTDISGDRRGEYHNRIAGFGPSKGDRAGAIAALIDMDILPRRKWLKKRWFWAVDPVNDPDVTAVFRRLPPPMWNRLIAKAVKRGHISLMRDMRRHGVPWSGNGLEYRRAFAVDHDIHWRELLRAGCPLPAHVTLMAAAMDRHGARSFLQHSGVPPHGDELLVAARNGNRETMELLCAMPGFGVWRGGELAVCPGPATAASALRLGCPIVGGEIGAVCGSFRWPLICSWIARPWGPTDPSHGMLLVYLGELQKLLMVLLGAGCALEGWEGAVLAQTLLDTFMAELLEHFERDVVVICGLVGAGIAAGAPLVPALRAMAAQC